MYLTRLTISPSRIAQGWLANPYRIHQRLKMACPSTLRILFRVEELEPNSIILVQTLELPDWAAAFNGFPVLVGLPEMKTFDPLMKERQIFSFRLLANPTVKKDGSRIGLMKDEDQQAWLVRHLAAGGADLLRIQTQPYHIQRSNKSAEKDHSTQTHLVVQFDGLLVCRDPQKLEKALSSGIGSAKGYGCGMLSLAKAG